jgi:hypothetical protein
MKYEEEKHTFSVRILTKYVLIVKEAGRTPPPFPFIFFKPNTTVIDHGAPVIIPKIAQDDQADYEGELVCIMSFKTLLQLFHCAGPYLIRVASHSHQVPSALSLVKMQRTSL